MKNIAYYSATIAATFFLAANVSAECSVGDQKCMADGFIGECVNTGNTTGPKTKWYPQGFRSCDRPSSSSSAGNSCTLDDLKCGPDGFLMRCTTTGLSSSNAPKMKWQGEARRCK